MRVPALKRGSRLDTLISGDLWGSAGPFGPTPDRGGCLTNIDGRVTKRVILAQGITSIRAVCNEMRHQFGFEGEAASTL
jgi:hypothetical protein